MSPEEKFQAALETLRKEADALRDVMLPGSLQSVVMGAYVKVVRAEADMCAALMDYLDERS